MRLWKLAALLIAILGLALAPMACGDDDNGGGEAEAEYEPSPDTGGGAEPTDGPAAEPPPDACPGPDSAGSDC